jgi:hypothetical protein
MSKKEIHYQGLAELSVIVEDTSALSPDYFKITQLPTELTAGLNTFKFKGQPQLFPENTEVYIEILDANGEPIYYEVNLDLESEEQPAIVSIFVTQDTTPGNGTIIICAGANQSAEGQILDPSEINIRWQVPIYIDISKRNEDAIIFSALPIVTLSSAKGSHQEVTYYDFSKTYPTANKSQTQSDDFTAVTNRINYYYNNDTPVIILPSDVDVNSYGFGAPINGFISHIENATISFAYSRIENSIPTRPSNIVQQIVSASVSGYSGSLIAYLSEPLSYALSNSNDRFYPKSLDLNRMSISYVMPTVPDAYGYVFSKTTENTFNVVTASFYNLEPITGEIAKIRTYYRSSGINEYIALNETDITTYAEEFGFNTSSLQTTFSLPTSHRNEKIDFKFEFVNPAGNASKQVIEVRDKTLSGGNTYIGGDDNLMTGSLYVAGSTGNGVHISGKGAAAMIRSIGYNGFFRATNSGPGGFVIYSGSIQPLLNASESYSGVGIELVANSSSYFKYTTAQGGQIDIIADGFFVGSENQFMSGANGNIEISSSNFHLAPDGTITMEGNITANTGLFENVLISGQVISGSGTALSGSNIAYLLESWVTSSLDRNIASGISYSGLTPLYNTNDTFAYGIFGWTASVNLNSAAYSTLNNPLFPYNMAAMNYNRGSNFENQSANPFSPPLFRKWKEVEGKLGDAYNGLNEVTTSIFGGGVGRFAPVVDTMMFLSPPLGSQVYSITSSLLTVPESLLGTEITAGGAFRKDVATGIGLQFAARMISGSVGGSSSNWSEFEGNYEKYRCTCDILNSSGSVIISETRYFKGNADWQQFNIPITAALLTINDIGDIEIKNQFKIRLSWAHGTLKPTGAKILPRTYTNLIRFTELRIVQYPTALGMQMSSILLDDSYITSDVSGSQHEGNWNPVNTDQHDLGTDYKRWKNVYSVTTNSDYSKIANGIVNPGDPYNLHDSPNSLTVYDGKSQLLSPSYNPAFEVNYDGDTAINNNLTVGMKIDEWYFGTGFFPATLNISGTLSYILPVPLNDALGGPKDSGTSGEIVHFGDFGSFSPGSVYYYSSLGTWELASAQTEASGSGMLSIATAPSTPRMLVKGFARYSGSANYNTLTTPGQKIYLSTTPGKFQTWAPSGSGEIVRILGYCINQPNTVTPLWYLDYDSTIYFTPDNSFKIN